MKVRIKSLPKSENGSQINNKFQVKQINWPGFSDSSSDGPKLKNTLAPVARDKANVEAEKGEVAIADMNFDGIPEHFVVGGQRHHSGGTPLNLPPDSFIFSDTQKMKIKDKEILARFGLSKGSYTPADIAKKYNINKYRGVLYDKDADRIQHESAEKMIQNYNQKLGELALIQESKKGFPQGIPTIAMPYLETHGIDPQQFLPQSPVSGQPGMQGENMAIQDGMEQQPMMRWGGFLPKAQMYIDKINQMNNFRNGGYLPKFQTRGEVPEYDNSIPSIDDPEYDKKMAQLHQLAKERDYLFGEGDRDNWEYLSKLWDMPRNMIGYNINGDYEGVGTHYMPNHPFVGGVVDYATNPLNWTPATGPKALKDAKGLAPYIAKAAEWTYNLGKKVPGLIWNGAKWMVEHPSVSIPVAGGIGSGTINSIEHSKPTQTNEQKLEPTDELAKELGLDTGKTTTAAKEIPLIDTVQGLPPELRKKLGLKIESKKFGGSLPKAEKGWEVKNGKYYYNDGTQVYEATKEDYEQATKAASSTAKTSSPGKSLNDPAIRPIPWSKVDPNKYEIIYPKGYIDNNSALGINPNAFDVPRIQNMDKPSHTYGNYDMADLKETRWKSYFDKKKSWDPTPTIEGINKRGEKYKYSKDVLDFQAHVNDNYIKAGLPPYFDGTPGFELDGLLKDHTYSAPAVVEKKKEPQMAKGTMEYEIRPNPEIPTAQRNTDAPWYVQDQNNYGLALNNLYDIHRYMPWQAVPDNKYLTPTLYDPERELAANSEMINQGVQGASTFTDPQAFNARFAQMQGPGAKNAADILSRYNNMNVGIANQTNAANTASYNQYSREKANLATSLFDKYTVVNQQFDNSRRQAKTEVVKALNQGITNSANTQAMNSLYDNYQIDPSTGGRLNWQPGGYQKFHANKPTDDYSDVWDLYETAKSKVGDEAALEILKAALGKSKKEKEISLPDGYPG